MKEKRKMRWLSFGILMLGIIILTGACEKNFTEINTDPNAFTTASDGSLFNEVVSSLIPGWNEQFYIHNEIFYKQTQLAALTREGWGNFTIGTEEIWKNYYLALPEIRKLEAQFGTYDNSPGVNNMRAMVKILLAYKTFKVTDIFGDIPFSQAGYGFQTLEYLRPKFDKQRDIYLQLLDDLKWAAENIDSTANTEPFVTFRGFDKLFFGKMTKWIKMANSLRLRHAMRMSEKEPVIAGEIIRDIIENNRPVFTGYEFGGKKQESACIVPANVGIKNEGVSWSFREHKNLRMGSNIWHLMSENDSAGGQGIFDPRAYIFFETNNANHWAPYPQNPVSAPAESGIPYDSHRDQTGGVFNNKGETCLYSPFNYFLLYDPYYMPIILITGAEVHFTKAEAWFRGIGVGVDKDKADNEYMNGINSSVDWWYSLTNSLKLPLSGMKFQETIPIPDGLDAVSVMNHYGSWMAQTEEQKLEFIYTQWMLDAFRQPWEVYALARRTGKTPREGAPLNHFRMPYPPSETEYNSANCASAIASQGGDQPVNKIWWIPD